MDPLSQRVTLEMHGSMWRDGRLVAEDEHALKMTMYFTNELGLMLDGAGFTDIVLQADYSNSPPTRESAFVIFIAKKPAGLLQGA